MELLGHDMFAEFSTRGHWWLPSQPSQAVFGTLSFSNDRIKLQLDRSFTPELDTAYSPGSVKFPVIFGVVNDGSRVTIARAFYLGSYKHEIDLAANEIIVGAHLDDVSNTIRQAKIKFTNLEECTARVLVDQSAIGDDGGVSFAVPNIVEPDLEILDLPQFKRLRLTTKLNVSRTHIQTKLTNESYFDLEFGSPVAVQTLVQLVRSIGNLLALLVGEPVWPKQVRLAIEAKPGGAEESAYYVSPPSVAEPRARTSYEMLLPLNDLTGMDVASVLFKNWFEKEQILRPIYDLLLGTVYSPGQYVQSTFLSLAQALESFHRRVYGGSYVAATDYSNVKSALMGAIPPDTDELLSKKLASMLEYGNEFSLKRRLGELFAEIQLDHVTNLCGTTNTKQFIRNVVNIRNYLTHYEGQKPSTLESVVETYNLNRRLSALLTLLIFKYLGLPENAVFIPVIGKLKLF
jgi:hypothetical protein